MQSHARYGLWSGLLATGPMTLTLFELFNRLPKHEQSPLPPSMVTDEVLPDAIKENLSVERHQDVVMALHYLYGAVTGAIYGAVHRKIQAPTAVKGAGYGLAVWALSYLGWLPALGMRPAAANMPARRNGMMILAHIVWGVTLALSTEELEQRGRRMLGASI